MKREPSNSSAKDPSPVQLSVAPLSRRRFPVTRLFLRAFFSQFRCEGFPGRFHYILILFAFGSVLASLFGRSDLPYLHDKIAEVVIAGIALLLTVPIAWFKMDIEIGKNCTVCEKEALARIGMSDAEERPFVLDADGILWYRGRRNVAFGVDTIICAFEAFGNNAGRPGDKGAFFHASGIEAGKVFAESFNSTYIDGYKLDHQGNHPSFEEARKAWETYDDKVGLGDMNLRHLTQSDDCPKGAIEIKNLFTEKRVVSTPNDPVRCEWMAGYIEGFLNNALVLGPTQGKTVVVRHPKCGLRGEECCFSVEIR